MPKVQKIVYAKLSLICQMRKLQFTLDRVDMLNLDKSGKEYQSLSDLLDDKILAEKVSLKSMIDSL